MREGQHPYDTSVKVKSSAPVEVFAVYSNGNTFEGFMKGQK